MFSWQNPADIVCQHSFSQFSPLADFCQLFMRWWSINPRSTTTTIGHVRYINILTWLRGFRGKITHFLKFLLSLNSQKRLDTKKTTPNLEVCPESLGAMLKYWYIERGLSSLLKNVSYQKLLRMRSWSQQVYWLWNSSDKFQFILLEFISNLFTKIAVTI